MKNAKRAKRVLLLLALCLFLSVLTSCNVIDAGKISEIAGTYRLTEYSVTGCYTGRDLKPVPEEERQTVDVLAETGMEVYLVITESGRGYYVYRDDETPRYCLPVVQEYDYEDEYDEETGEWNTTDKISKIELKSGTESIAELYVQNKRKTFTDNTSAWKSSFTGAITGKKYYVGNDSDIDITYKRVSTAQDLSFVSKEVGTTVTPVATEYVPFVRTTVFSAYRRDTDRLYDYYVFHYDTLKVAHCYADSGEHPVAMEENLDFSYLAGENGYLIGEEHFAIDTTFGFGLKIDGDGKYVTLTGYSSSESEVRASMAEVIAQYSSPAD